MKRLKKSLVVLLVLAMALTMVPFAGASGITTVASFNDAEQVTAGDHVMALDVMAALNILRGVDGNIQPQRNVTRAEAATIVARTLLGPAAADTLPPATSFRDVAVTSFASGSIGYLYEQGIVVGIGDGLFNPQGYVTGAELAAMFLRAVGFGVNGEYVGPRWQTNAVVDGMHWRILTGEADFTAPASREDVFLYAFNAMNSALEDEDVGLRFVNWSADRQAYVPVLLQGGWGVTGGGDVQGLETIYRRIFRPAPINLHRNDNVADMFGRPATRFTLRGIEIGTYAREAAVTFNRFTSVAAVNEALSGFNTNAFVHRFINGNPFVYGSGGTWYIEGNGVAQFTAATANGILANANTGEQISRLTGNGILVEIFVNQNTNAVSHVSVIRTDIVEVTRVDAGARETHFALLTQDGDDSIRSAAFGAANYAGASMRVGPLHDLFDEVDLRIEDRVLLTPVWRHGEWQVGAIAEPEVVTGTMTTSATMVNFTNNAGTVTVGGTAYTRARILTTGARQATMTGPNQEVTLLLDEHGFIVDTETRGVATRRMVFVRDVQSTLHNGVIAPVVRGWYPDGTEATVALPGALGAGGAVAGDIVRIVGTGNNVHAVVQYAAAPAEVLPPTIDATATVGTVNVVQMTNAINAITPNQATLNVGGRILRFADDAQYFFWGAPPAGGAAEFRVRDRNIRVEPAGAQLLNNLVRGDDNIVAVVEYRQAGQLPVITALWIGRHQVAHVSPTTTIFVRGVDNIFHHTVNIEGQTYHMVQAWNLNGNAFDWTWPGTENIPAGWIPVRNLPNLNTVPNAFYTFTIDSQNRFELTEVVNDTYENLGIFTQVLATQNALTNAVVFIDDGGVVPGSGDTIAVNVTGQTTFHNHSHLAGALAINDLASLNARLAEGRAIRISVAFDVNSQLATAIFINSST